MNLVYRTRLECLSASIVDAEHHGSKMEYRTVIQGEEENLELIANYPLLCGCIEGAG